VGTFAVQIAKSFGAEVTGVCRTRNVDLVRSLGADHVIDYTREDFTRGTKAYDLLFDCVGNRSLLAFRRVLRPKGICVLVGAPHNVWLILARALAALALSRVVGQTFVMLMAKLSKEDLSVIAGLMEAGKVKPVVDRSYALAEVPDAMRYLEEGHARGKIVITV
jgi:NADPH:quinone reductase-like Zn-dependent oxidoreductase